VIFEVIDDLRKSYVPAGAGLSEVVLFGRRGRSLERAKKV
jgi:hypothetical protein